MKRPTRREAAVAMLLSGHGIDAIASEMGVKISTARRYCQGNRCPTRRASAADAGNDFRDRQGPIRCVCGAPTPHEAARVIRGKRIHTSRVGGVPWGFCSMGCYNLGIEALSALLGGS